MVTIKQLLEAGVHFGHQRRRWNPKMSPYIFGERNDIHIINLEKTLQSLLVACEFLKQVAAQGNSILLVGTKKQARDIVADVSQKTEMPYVNERWLGGMLTNFETVRRSVKRLEQIEGMEQEGTYQFLTKKEVNSLKKEREKLQKVLVGVRSMKRLPGAIFVFDPINEAIAVHEARKLKIPVVALIDTNGDPDLVDYLIPGNDDAIRSLRLMGELVAASITEGRNQFRHIEAEQLAAETEGAEVSQAPITEKEEEVIEVIEEEIVSKLKDEEKPAAKKPRAAGSKE